MRTGMLLGSVSRQSGGLFTSVRRLSQSVAAANGGEVEVLSFRDECTDADVPQWAPLRPMTFTSSGFPGYARCSRLKKAVLDSEIDLLHLHGVWMYTAYASLVWQRRTRRHLVISPRGMLDPWALENSRWKKRVVSLLYASASLRAAACIHALCESEYQSIRAYGLNNPVCVIPNGVDLPKENQCADNRWLVELAQGRRVMLFLGRLHPKKGLLNLIKAWVRLKIENRIAIDNWVLAIAGWSQVGHEEELKKLVKKLDCQSDILFLGPVYGDRKQVVLHSADAFVLPSHSEGLPVSVLEAWSCGLPVLMTQFCNIPEGFEASAAFEIQPEPYSIAEGLKKFFALSADEQRQTGRNGLELVRDTFTWPKIAAQMVDVYKWVLDRGDKPDCVRLE